MLKKTDKDDHDGKSRYISNIVTLTRQQIEIIKLVDRYEEINEYFMEIEKQKKQRELQVRKWRREVEQQEQIEFENEKHRKQMEIEEEKIIKV